MPDADALAGRIRAAFADGRYPGDAFLVGSRDGCEPYDVVSNFFGRQEWWTLAPGFLDAHYEALSFFSEAGFRFFIPAYLIADLNGQLNTADPTFHLTHGFRMSEFDYPGVARTFVRRTGGASLLNPRRYGAMTWEDYARFRLSVFSREECVTIVDYLRHKRALDLASTMCRPSTRRSLRSGKREQRPLRPPPTSRHICRKSRSSASISNGSSKGGRNHNEEFARDLESWLLRGDERRDCRPDTAPVAALP